MADLKLKVIMDLADKAAGPLRNITRGSKEAAQALKAARDTVKQLNDQQRKVDGFQKQQAALKAASTQTKVLQQNVHALTRAHGANTPQVKAAEKALAKATTQYEKQRDAAFKLRAELNRAGIGKLADAQARIKTETAAANAQIERQTQRLKQLASVQRTASQMKARGESMALAGGGMLAAGAVVGAAGGTAIQAYTEQETATTKLRSAMMQANGATTAEYAKINELAMRLGDRLPGTTADFITMMTQLRRQGLAANTILGGTGEATAYLSVMLNKAPEDAAVFAAKLQDATRTVDRDMMGLMDNIQRAYFMGVDDNNMLAGFAKLSPALSVLRMEGTKAAQALTPLLVMADQAGMAGEAAGNAYRQLFQRSMDPEKIAKANKALTGTGVNLSFSDGKGEFAGIDNMLAQLTQLRAVNTEQRLGALKEAFGDDSETLQALTLMIEKGQAGYNDVVTRMAGQASLQQRVNAELQTIANLKDAASGSFTNVLAALGETVAPETRALAQGLGDVAANTRAWVAENPMLAGWLVKIGLVIGVLLLGLGGAALAIGAVTLAIGTLLPFIGPLLGGLKLVGGTIAMVGRLLLLNPIGLAITGIALAALLIYKYWGPITSFFRTMWADITLGARTLWQGFTGLGAQLMDGLVGGIMGRIGAVRDAIGKAADSAIGWFREKLGIKSPSRVFMAAGHHLGEGAAIGISRSAALVQRASAGLTAAALVPGMAMAGARIDARPPLGAGASSAPTMVQGDTITIHVSAAPGQDPQSLARAIAAELDRRASAKQARARGSLTDIN